jgi:hypothetical protein
MKKSIKFFLFVFLLCGPLLVSAQDDLMGLIAAPEETEEQVGSIFKGSRIVNGHSVETRGAGSMEVIFMHRFGRINSGAYNLWGLDEAWIRLGMEYAVTDNLTIGLGRSSYEKTFDGFLKFGFVRQTRGSKKFPFTGTAFMSMAINTLKSNDPEREIKFSSRVSYAYQVLLARKFTKNLSIQLSPTLVHHNLVDTPQEHNDIYALGLSGRQKISRRTAITLEYYYQFNNNTEDVNYNALGIGFEIETGGHVFQMVFSNSQVMIEKSFITETSGNFFDGDIHFGFNITRAFHLKREKIPEEW